MSGRINHCDEKIGVAIKEEEWGRWWQTAGEVHIEVKLPEGTRAKVLKVHLKSTEIEVFIGASEVFKGPLFGIIRVDESTWAVEDGNLLRIQLQKADYSSTNSFVWQSLLKDAFFLDKPELNNLMQKVDLENLQLENPAYDFSKFKPLK